FFFFFQAEDGIRDFHVTGVQTCALPILGVVVQDNFNLKDENRKLRDRMLEMERALAEYQRREETRKERMEGRMRALEAMVGALRSEERRVGKGGRCVGGADEEEMQSERQ